MKEQVTYKNDGGYCYKNDGGCVKGIKLNLLTQKYDTEVEYKLTFDKQILTLFVGSYDTLELARSMQLRMNNRLYDINRIKLDEEIQLVISKVKEELPKLSVTESK